MGERDYDRLLKLREKRKNLKRQYLKLFHQPIPPKGVNLNGDPLGNCKICDNQLIDHPCKWLYDTCDVCSRTMCMGCGRFEKDEDYDIICSKCSTK